MDKFKFGTTDLMVPRVCFGGNVFGWTLSEKESFYMLDMLLDYGLNFIDTANNYSHWVSGNAGGESETIIGKWLQQSGNRSKIVLSTKVGGTMGDGSKGLKGDYIKKSLQESLVRLNTDFIDLYFSHYDDLQTPQQETMHVYNDLVTQGKVRFLGASNLSAQRIVSANAIAREQGWHSYSAIQPLYNLYDRETFEKEYLPIAKQENLAVISYFALASGFLSGKYKNLQDAEHSKRKDMVVKYFNARGSRILQAVADIANKYNVTMSQVAIAWQLHRAHITAPIVSATSKIQLHELVNCVTLDLTQEDMQQLNSASDY
ncbi:aldo/keto reductase [Myroides sp. LJL119]